MNHLLHDCLDDTDQVGQILVQIVMPHPDGCHKLRERFHNLRGTIPTVSGKWMILREVFCLCGNLQFRMVVSPADEAHHLHKIFT